MRQMRIYLVMFLALALMVACGGENSSKERAFATLVPVPMDTGLRLEVVEVDETPSGAPRITLLLENRSGDQVWFPSPLYGARVFVYSESSAEWDEVENHVIPASEGGEDILVPKGEGINWIAGVLVVPSIPDASRAVTLRIVVIGEIYREGRRTGEEVGAYLDVTLRP